MSVADAAAVRVRPVREEDFDQWRALYRGYAEFYRVEQTEDAARLVWSWIHDPAHEVEGLVAEGADGGGQRAGEGPEVGEPDEQPVGGWLDDLFVDPASRGTGAADLLLAALRGIGAERGWSVVRWITADDNHRARSKYDQVATRTMWITYDMAPEV